ncbi:MAG TPA: hypothetical protein VGG28_25630 [Kofleriaceae bacterium]
MDGADGLLVPGAMVIVGELHGTREIPAAFDQLARTATCELVVGLEIPRDEPSWFWTREIQDGRSSEAIAMLIESLRARGVRVVAFDADESTWDQREHAMAERLLATRAAHPHAALLVLTGNLHARLAADAIVEAPDGLWLAQRIPNVLSFDAVYGAGTAWNCDRVDDPGGIKPVLGDDVGPVRITRGGSPAYSGLLHVGPVSASPPAISRRSRR